jgi:hypothetical protein
MKHFTPERFEPSEQSLELIRQFAYSYPVETKPQAARLN